MEKKVIAILAVAVILVAGVCTYMIVGNDDDGDDSTTGGAHAVSLDGIEPNDKNVLDGTYSIARNLILCTKGEPSGNTACFLDWIMSPEGQEILSTEFVPLTESQMVSDPAEPSGSSTIKVGGSTSISPIMGELAKAYHEKYPGITITIVSNGSGPGAKGAVDGTYDIGMCSRDLKESEVAQGLVPHSIGKDGVAVIVNIAGVDSLTTEQVAKIYSGEITNWNEVGGPDKKIAVYSREDGSGTRDCFDSAMKHTVEGWKIKAEIATYNNTGGIIGAVQSNDGSIGYISIGHLARL